MSFYNTYEGCFSYKDRYERAEALLGLKYNNREEIKKKMSTINISSLVALIATFYLTKNIALEYMFFFVVIVGALMMNYLHNGDILSGLNIEVERLENDFIKYKQSHKWEEKLNSESFFFNYKKENSTHNKPKKDSHEQNGIFDNCTTVQDIKKTYKERAKKCHPDLGGDKAEFIILNEEYKKALDLANAA